MQGSLTPDVAGRMKFNEIETLRCSANANAVLKGEEECSIGPLKLLQGPVAPENGGQPSMMKRYTDGQA